MSAKRLLTIGYEGLQPGTLVAALRNAGAHVLIDVRELPLSRRRGFSKAALAELLARQDIEYVHLRDLGDPKSGREAARAGNYREFRKIYGAHLRTKRAQDALAAAVSIAKKRVSCLLCYERNPVQCHRSIVAALVEARASLAVEHLIVDEKVNSGRRDGGGRKITDLGQGIAAAE